MTTNNHIHHRGPNVPHVRATPPSRAPGTSQRAGAAGALIAAATFVFGIALFVTSLSDYTEGDATAP